MGLSEEKYLSIECDGCHSGEPFSYDGSGTSTLVSSIDEAIEVVRDCGGTYDEVNGKILCEECANPEEEVEAIATPLDMAPPLHEVPLPDNVIPLRPDSVA